MHDRVKINFHLEQNEDGYPPYEWEGVWSEKQEKGSYRIDNIPFYIKDLSVDDVVLATESENGLIYVETLKKSNNATIRIICYSDEAKRELLNKLSSLICDYEVGVPLDLVAVNIPPSANIDVLLEYLDEQSSAGMMDYEESSPRYLGKNGNPQPPVKNSLTNEAEKRHSNLQDTGLHRLQHKYDDFGRKNKERPATGG
jgi:hypothetical protein